MAGRFQIQNEEEKNRENKTPNDKPKRGISTVDIPDLEMISFETHWAIRAKSELQKVNDCQRHRIVNSQSHTGDPKLTDSPIAQEVCTVRHHGQMRKN